MAGKKIYVFSTLANDQKYTNWADGGGGTNIETGSVLIRGGAGVANERIITPLGVSTEIDEDQLEILEKNSDYQRHVKLGFIKTQAKHSDPEKVAADMNRADASAPLTPTAVAELGEVDAKD